MSLMFLESCKYNSNKARKNEDENDASKKYKSNFVLSDHIQHEYEIILREKREEPDKKIPPNF